MKPLDTHANSFAKLMQFDSFCGKYILAPGNTWRIHVESGCKVICDRCLRKSTKCQEFYIPETVKCIGEYALASPALERIEFSAAGKDSWLWVKAHAFDETPSLNSLTLPACDIHLGSRVFGPDLKTLRFLNPVPPECEPDTFATATKLRRIIVDKSCVDVYAASLSKLCPEAKVEPYISPEEKKALNKQRKLEKIEQEHNEKEAKKVDATIRVFLPTDQRTEVRWTTKSSKSSVPTVVSQSHPQAVVELQIGKKPDSKVAYYLDITNLKDLDKLRTKVSDNRFQGVKGAYAQWQMHPKAPKVAHKILEELQTGNLFTGYDALKDFMLRRDSFKLTSFKTDYEAENLKDLDGQGLMLEYRIKLDPENFNAGKIVFFSFKGKTVSDDDELCGDLSRQAKVRARNASQIAEYQKEMAEQREMNDELRRIRQSNMNFLGRAIDNWINASSVDKGVLDHIDSLEQSDADDNIVWFDMINYDTQLGALMKVYRVNTDNTLEELNIKA